VIDFSRACIHPDYYDDYIDNYISESNVTDDIISLEEYDRQLLLNLYMQLFPNKAKKRDEYNVLFKLHFNKVFHIMTAVDVYMFSARLIKLVIDKPISRKSMELMTSLHRESEAYLTREMNSLLENPNDYKISAYPNCVFMEKFFKEFTAPINPDFVMVNYTNVENEFVYNFGKEKLPRGIGTYETMDEAGNITENPSETKTRHKLFQATSNILNENYSIINEYAAALRNTRAYK
jgi:hypothetical protein